jgi:hypothetical protein
MIDITSIKAMAPTRDVEADVARIKNMALEPEELMAEVESSLSNPQEYVLAVVVEAFW